MLNAEQQAVAGAIVADPTGLHVLTGPGGVGKTALIKWITRELRSLPEPKVMLLDTPT